MEECHFNDGPRIGHFSGHFEEQQWLDLLLMAIGAVLTVLVTAVNLVAFIPK